MAIWLDTETGTYGSVAPVLLDTDNWLDMDYTTFEDEMTDSERADYGVMVADYFMHHPEAEPESVPTPYEWHNDTAVAQ